MRKLIWKHFVRAGLGAFLTLFALACAFDGEGNSFSDCKYDRPQPIFESDLPTVVEHQFDIRRMKGIEEVEFSGHPDLTIIQSGCDHIRQEFQFELDSLPQNTEAAFWIDLAQEQFHRLGNLSPDYLVFLSWAQEIKEKAYQIKLAESIELQPGFYVRIDKIISRNSAILLVVLSENP
ncbi:MAG: hypothetical protein R3350_05395 [Saprospiraceae bacterium]|nr:hypothetical protein [Saprospiraceae bacterium]